MQAVTADAHPTVLEAATRMWNGLPSLWKALIPAIGALLIVLVPASIFISARIYAVTTDNLRAQHDTILTDISTNFEDLLNTQTSYLADYANSDVVKACAPTGCNVQARDVFGAELTRKIQDPSAYYTEIGFIDNNGTETARVVRGTGSVVNVANTPVSFKVSALMALTAGQVYVFPISRDTRIAASESYQYPLLRMATPVFVNEQRQGFVTAAINLDDFFSQNFVFSDQHQTFLLDGEGCLLASSDDAQRPELYKTWAGDPSRTCYKDLQLQDWDTAVQHYQATVLSTRPLHGVLSNSGQTWTIVVQQPESLAYTQANTLDALLRAAYLTTMVVVGALIVAADRASARLLKAVQARNVSHARDIRFNPYVVGGPVEDRRLFFGRTEALARVIGAGVMGGDDVLIDGDRYIGKTSLLRQVERRLQDRRVTDPTYWYWPVSLSLQGVPVDKFYATLMDHILRDVEDHATRLTLRYHTNSANYAVEDFREDIVQLLNLPNPSDNQTRIVLCLDNIHVWLGPSRDDRTFIQTFSAMRLAIGSQLKLIATGSRIPEDAFDRTMTAVTLGPLDYEEAERMVRQPVAEYYPYTDEALAKILQASDRLPIELQRLAHYAVQAMLETDASAVSAVHADRALQRAIADHEPTYRLLWNGGVDKNGNTVARFSDEIRAKMLDLDVRDTSIPPLLFTGESPVISAAQLDEISYTDSDGNVRLTAIFKAWLARAAR